MISHRFDQHQKKKTPLWKPKTIKAKLFGITNAKHLTLDSENTKAFSFTKSDVPVYCKL